MAASPTSSHSGAAPGPPSVNTFCNARRVTILYVTTITIRTDEETDRALAELTRDNRSRSDVIREAILLAYREERAARLRAEAEEAASDPDDLAEVRAIREEMDAISAW